MNKTCTIAFVSLTAIITHLSASEAVEPKPDGSVPLAEAIETFNARASQNTVGKEQPPLTEDEVIASIRWWEFHRKDSPVSDGDFRAFLALAETRRLPSGWVFEVLTDFEPNDRVAFKAWSVRIVMPKDDGGTYAFDIRERMVGSRAIGPEERKVIEKWQKSGIGSLQREEYARERQAAAGADELKARITRR